MLQLCLVSQVLVLDSNKDLPILLLSLAFPDVRLCHEVLVLDSNKDLPILLLSLALPDVRLCCGNTRHNKLGAPGCCLEPKGSALELVIRFWRSSVTPRHTWSSCMQCPCLCARVDAGILTPRCLYLWRPLSCHPLVFETGSLTGLELTESDRLTSHWSTGSSCLHRPIEGFPSCWAFCVFCGLSSGPQVCGGRFTG